MARVPSYSPSSIAEYAVSSILALAKNLQRSYEQTKLGDFTIGGLQCILMEDKTVGVVGTGLIGRKTAEKISGLCRRVLCVDAYPNADWIKGLANAEYVPLERLLAESDVISIHVPLLPDTRHLIDASAIGKMRKHVIVVNTSRGEVVATGDLVAALKAGKIFGAALDVFEGEKAFIYKDVSGSGGFRDFPELDELSKMSNVILSSHVAFYTDESVRQITEKTLANFEQFFAEGDTAELDETAFVA